MPGRKTILIITDSSAASGHVELEGAGAYARRLGTWRYWSLPASDQSIANVMHEQRFDGVLGHFRAPELVEFILERGIPAVSLPGPAVGGDLPYVTHDHVRIGAVAAEHLLSLGFRHFAYIGDTNAASLDRLVGFSRALEAYGHTCFTPDQLNDTGRHAEWSDISRPAQLVPMLRRLPLPVGVLAFNDQIAIAVADAAQEAGIRIPQQMALIGIDNNRLRCEFSRVPLTSIDPDLYRVSYEAAALLHRLMRGEPAPEAPILVAPGALVQRQSTDIQAFDDPAFAEALRYLREHALEGVSIKQATAHLGISRIALERACRRYLGRSPAEELRRLRIEHARKLLAETDLKTMDIARRCGFDYLSHFSRYFTRQAGLSPKAYRARYQRLQVGR